MWKLPEFLGFVGYLILSIGFSSQIIKTYIRKSVADISWIDVLCRTMSPVLITILMLRTKNMLCIIGQGTVAFCGIMYLIIFLYYSLKKSQKEGVSNA